MTSKDLFDLIDKDRGVLRLVVIKFRALDEMVKLYYRPLTAIQHRDARYLATRKKQLKRVDSETVQEVEYIDEYLFACAIIYLQALNEDGKRIFNSITEVEELAKKLDFSDLSVLAGKMGIDVDSRLKEVSNG